MFISFPLQKNLIWIQFSFYFSKLIIKLNIQNAKFELNMYIIKLSRETALLLDLYEKQGKLHNADIGD